LPAVWFSSCAKEENDNDGVPPRISDIRFNLKDTIVFNETSITINGTATKGETDTLVIGKLAYIAGHFSTNKDSVLSGYAVFLYVKMYNKNKVINDTLRAVGGNIFGRTDVIISRNNLITIPDSISKREKTAAGADTTSIYYPQEGDYVAEIKCGDIYGNRDSISHPIRLMSRQSIYDSRTK